VKGEPLWGHEAEAVLNTILKDSRFSGWRGFMDGHWAFMESPHVAIMRDDVNAMQAWYVDQVGCVYRETPRPGVYLRFRIIDPRDDDPSWHVKRFSGSF
jgi:hypothetical protein